MEDIVLLAQLAKYGPAKKLVANALIKEGRSPGNGRIPMLWGLCKLFADNDAWVESEGVWEMRKL